MNFIDYCPLNRLLLQLFETVTDPADGFDIVPNGTKLLSQGHKVGVDSSSNNMHSLTRDFFYQF